MELLVASAVGTMTACGTYLILRHRTFPVVVGLALISYAVNIFIFASGRIAIGMPPLLTSDAGGHTDPLTQALVLTAIVISFGMTAVIVVMALGSFLETGSDRIDMTVDDAAYESSKHGEDAR